MLEKIKKDAEWNKGTTNYVKKMWFLLRISKNVSVKSIIPAIRASINLCELLVLDITNNDFDLPIND